MAALTTERSTNEIANGAHSLVLPVKASTTIYQGAIVAIDASGYAIPGKKATGLKTAGRAEETVFNDGADGAVTIKVTRGVFVYNNTATAANKITGPTSWAPATSRMIRRSPSWPPAPRLPAPSSVWTMRAWPWRWASGPFSPPLALNGKPSNKEDKQL